MMKVWKFALPSQVGQEVEIEMPAGAQIVMVGVQGTAPMLHYGGAFIWAVVDPGAPLERRRFVLVGTGQDVPAGWRHVGSFQEDAGDTYPTPTFVWHLFEPGVPVWDRLF